MNSFLWQYPWAWWLLLLLPLFFWKSPPRQPMARVLATLDGWNLARTAPTGWRHLAWSSLWPWILLLLLTIVLAAGPSWSGGTPSSDEEKIGVVAATATRLPGPQGETLLWEAILHPPVNRDGFVVVSDGRGLLSRQAVVAGDKSEPQVVGGSVVLEENRPGPWTISWRDENGQSDAAHHQASLFPADPPIRRAIFVSRAEPWFFSRLLENWAEWDFVRVLPAEWDPDEEADVVIFLDPPEREIPPEWLGSRAAWFWGFGPGGRGAQQDFPIALEKEELHPVTGGVPLERVTVLEAFEPLPPENEEWAVEALAQGPSGPWLLAGERGSPTGQGRWLATAFALESSDLPLQTAFPVLVAQGLDWLTGSAETSKVVPGEKPPSLAEILASFLSTPAFWTSLLFLGALWIVVRELP